MLGVWVENFVDHLKNNFSSSSIRVSIDNCQYLLLRLLAKIPFRRTYEYVGERLFLLCYLRMCLSQCIVSYRRVSFGQVIRQVKATGRILLDFLF